MTKRLFLIFPYLALNSVVILAALFKAIQVSFGYYPVIGMKEWTTAHFKTVLTDSFFQKSVGYSLYLAIVATTLSLVLGTILAFWLLRSPHSWAKKILQLPIALPHLIVALMILQLFSQSGLFSRLLFQIGLIKEISQFPLLIHDSGGIGIMLVFLYKEVPYVAISTLAILQQLQFGYVEVAQNLGASRKQIFFSIILPMIQPILATLFVILFCFTFASFEVPYLLGNPRNETVAVTAYTLFTQADLRVRPQAYALNILMSLICLAATLSVLAVSRILPGGKSYD